MKKLLCGRRSCEISLERRHLGYQMSVFQESAKSRTGYIDEIITNEAGLYEGNLIRYFQMRTFLCLAMSLVIQMRQYNI